MNIQFEVLTSRGILVHTFADLALAKRYVLSKKQDVPGLRIDRVETITVRSSVYRPRASVRAA